MTESSYTNEQPLFTLAYVATNGEPSEADMRVFVPHEPDEDAPAPLALIYGLALMTVEQMGLIDNEVDRLTEGELPSEAEVVRRIEFLMQGKVNVLNS